MTPRKVALVTGASRGIGAALAEGLAARGYWVWCAARTLVPDRAGLPGSLLQTQSRIRAAGGVASVVAGDVNRPEVLGELFQAIGRAAAGPPELVVHAAMTRTALPFADLDLATWQECTGRNIDGLFLLCRHCASVMSGGSIVVVTSAMADGNRAVPASCLAYATAKAAIERFVTAAAAFLAGADVALNALRPGATRTEYAEADLGPGADLSGWAEPAGLLAPVLVLARQRPRAGGISGRVIEARDLRPGAGPPS